MKPRRLLIVDVPDDYTYIAEALKSRYTVDGVAAVEEATQRLRDRTYDVVICDLSSSGKYGDRLCNAIGMLDSSPLVIAIADDVERIAEMLRTTVHDYLEKPFTIEHVLHTVAKALQVCDLKASNEALSRRIEQQPSSRALVGNSSVMQAVRDKLDVIAPSGATVLVTGESGTGKEVLAQEIHRLSDRADKPFVTVSCSVPERLLDEELFGRAVSSAGTVAVGKFERADGGTLVIAEVGEMPAATQAKMLRVLQSGGFDRNGTGERVDVDVRVIATTRRALRPEIDGGGFSEDLFFCLNVVPIEMPPLRARREDIPLLVGHFVEKFSKHSGRPSPQLTEGAVRKLTTAYWRGNVRELENIIERAAILCDGSELDEDYFEFEDNRDERLSMVEHAFRHGTVRGMERLMIENRLRENSQNRTRAAGTLEISVRTLRNKLREYREAAEPARLATAGADS